MTKSSYVYLARNASVVFGLKFGCKPDRETVRMIQLTKDLSLNLHGFSFYIDSFCGEFEAYSRGIALCKQLIAISKAISCDDARA